jgi:hypothetical protein
MRRWTAGAALLLLYASASVRADEAASLFVDPEDRWFDVSAFVAKKYGFVPIVAPVTEPAVGYGAFAGLVFIDREPAAPRGERPDLYVVGGMYTESNSWASFGGYAGNWLDGRLRVVAGGGYISLNLKHYGLGDDPALAQNPIEYNLQGALAGVSAAMQLGSTPIYAGMGAGFGYMQADPHETLAGASTAQNTLLGLRPLVKFDTRDNMFTPTRGLFGEAGFTFAHQSEGSWFERLDLTAIGYTPLFIPELFLGVRGGANFSFGDAPFYLRPFVVLRGAPSMRYQGEQTAEMEVELRWQFWKRLSLVGFGGVGAAWKNLSGFDRSEGVVTYGTGFRYELARQYGLHMGADFAFGQDGFALYIQFGSAWTRL